MAYKEKKRERRRRDLQRMKTKSIGLAKIQIRMMYWRENESCNAMRSRMMNRAVVHAEYMAVCSCDQCGNPRRLGSIPLREIRENDKLSSYEY